MENSPVFIDTSAFYAIIDRSDIFHEQSGEAWSLLLQTDKVSHNQQLRHSWNNTLLQNRIGQKAALIFNNDILRVVDVHWITQIIHESSVELWKNLGRRNLSLVDCSSFILMGQTQCSEAFSMDRHFTDQGYTLLPENL